MRAVLFALAACCAWAGEPKQKPEDYPVHARPGKAALGADFTVHSFSDGRQFFVTEAHLVVEIAVYPAKGEPLMVSTQQFTLKVNGKKQLVYAQTPGMVAASLKYPDWERRRKLEAYGGIGNAGVILGRPSPVERFPGDPRARSPLPPAPRAPEAERTKAPEPTAEEVAVSAALPEGETSSAVAGYVYFPYRGKVKDIRDLRLLYSGPAGQAELRLR
ncbi:MAG: hypothetical protein ACE15B_13755 [Bryobacteraceae bacterium]